MKPSELAEIETEKAFNHMKDMFKRMGATLTDQQFEAVKLILINVYMDGQIAELKDQQGEG